MSEIDDICFMALRECVVCESVCVMGNCVDKTNDQKNYTILKMQWIWNRVN